jgi:hypothetical protein
MSSKIHTVAMSVIMNINRNISHEMFISIHPLKAPHSPKSKQNTDLMQYTFLDIYQCLPDIGFLRCYQASQTRKGGTARA